MLENFITWKYFTLRYTEYFSVECIRRIDRKSTRLNSSHSQISYAVFCLKKKKKKKKKYIKQENNKIKITKNYTIYMIANIMLHIQSLCNVIETMCCYDTKSGMTHIT